jgi:hypothetical protein
VPVSIFMSMLLRNYILSYSLRFGSRSILWVTVIFFELSLVDMFEDCYISNLAFSSLEIQK